MVHATTSETWESDILRSDLPVFVDFWAEWCGPCRMVGPAVEHVEKVLEGRVSVAKVNVDENPDIAARYDIHSIPSLVLFRGGQKVSRTIGAAPKEAYIKFIEKSLAA